MSFEEESQYIVNHEYHMGQLRKVLDQLENYNYTTKEEQQWWENKLKIAATCFYIEKEFCVCSRC